MLKLMTWTWTVETLMTRRTVMTRMTYEWPGDAVCLWCVCVCALVLRLVRRRRAAPERHFGRQVAACTMFGPMRCLSVEDMQAKVLLTASCWKTFPLCIALC